MLVGDRKVLPVTVFYPGRKPIYRFTEENCIDVFISPEDIECVELLQSSSILGWMHRRECSKRSERRV
jgi:hypothetical protein